MSPLFTLTDVGLTVDDTTVLQAVDLELPDAGVTVVVGPSGSGKSTLLRLLNRLERATSGTIRFRGTDIDDIDVRALRRRVGMVFQRPTVFDGTALDNLRVADPGISEADALRALERVGLGADLADRNARSLSGGEAQRLCLTRTLLTGPEVVLLDEPTSALDEESVHKIEHLAGEIAAAGVRLVWVSHDREQVRRVSNWIVRLDEGRVVESGPARAMGHVHDAEGLWRTADEDGAAESGAERGADDASDADPGATT